MAQTFNFEEIVEAVDELPEKDQEQLLRIVRQRRIERGRERLVREVEEARREIADGHAAEATPAEIVREIFD